MRKKFNKLIKNVFKALGFALVKEKTYTNLLAKKNIAHEYLYLKEYPTSQYENYFKYRKLSNSQLRQELFALMELNFKKNGFFVEFGATNGVSLSNTYLLEKEFNWDGILAEPSKCWHEELSKNREVNIDRRCVWKESNKELLFKEVDNPSLSTIEGFGDNDAHTKSRENSLSYKVESISLNDLLDYYNAPKIIDFLSIDTEGSEFEILESFDFSKYKFRTITVEHNFSKDQEKIYKLMVKNGYERIFKEYSSHDDWYILKSKE